MKEDRKVATKKGFPGKSEKEYFSPRCPLLLLLSLLSNRKENKQPQCSPLTISMLVQDDDDKNFPSVINCMSAAGDFYLKQFVLPTKC